MKKNLLYTIKNKILKICRLCEGGDPCSQRHHATPKMDSRLRGKDNIIFVMYKEKNKRIGVKWIIVRYNPNLYWAVSSAGRAGDS